MKLCPSCGHPESWGHRCGGVEDRSAANGPRQALTGVDDDAAESVTACLDGSAAASRAPSAAQDRAIAEAARKLVAATSIHEQQEAAYEMSRTIKGESALIQERRGA